MQVLLSYNADVNIRCKYSKLTAIQVAMFEDHKDLVELLYKPTLYQRTPSILKEIQSNNFESLPTNPQQLKQSLIAYHDHQQQEEAKSPILDMHENSEIETEYEMIQENIKDLFQKLKVEYDKLLKVQSVRNEEKLKITDNRNKMKLWDEFESLWIYWDILCFIECKFLLEIL